MNSLKTEKKSALFKKRMDLKQVSIKKLSKVLGIARKQKMMTVALAFLALLLLTGGVIAAKHIISKSIESLKYEPRLEVKNTPSTPPTPTPIASPTPSDNSMFNRDNSFAQSEHQKPIPSPVVLPNPTVISIPTQAPINIPTTIPSSPTDIINIHILDKILN